MSAAIQTKLVYAVVGADGFLRQLATHELMLRLAPEPDSLGVAKFQGSQASLAEVLDEARTPSLLGGQRVVLLDEADDFISEHREALERYCGAPAASSSLVFSCQSMPSTTRLYKIIQKVGEIVAVAAPKPRELIDWITRRAKSQYGKQLNAHTAQRLRDVSGDSTGVLDSELSKLATFVGDRPEITAGDVEAICGHTREEKVFAIMDSVLSGNAHNALMLWEQVLVTDRAAPHKALAGLAWSVRASLAARIEWESGVSAYQLSRKLFTDPATAERRLQSADRHALTEMQRDLLTADVGVKTGATTPESAVESFIVKHSSRKRILRDPIG